VNGQKIANHKNKCRCKKAEKTGRNIFRAGFKFKHSLGPLSRRILDRAELLRLHPNTRRISDHVAGRERGTLRT
jgi:hypothetical protein